MRDVVVIPARLNSLRFPKKILFNIKGLPMLEHVRRRVLLSKKVDNVFIATCDNEIKNVMESFGANVIMTSAKHLNGTSRVAEAIENIDCKNVILIQGDEPLILPNDIEYFINNVKNSSNTNAWNATKKEWQPGAINPLHPEGIPTISDLKIYLSQHIIVKDSHNMR